MHLAALETFLAILDEGSLVRAARRLHVTQSTVTARLKTLEAEMGHELIVRSKAGATPTEAGRRLRRNAETMLDLWNQACRDAALPDPSGGACSLGCDDDLWNGVGSTIVAWLRDRDPAIALSVRLGRSPELVEWQRNGLVDLSITYTNQAGPGHRLHELRSDLLVLVSTDPAAPLHYDPGYVFVEAGEEFARWHAATYATARIAEVSFSSPVAALDHIVGFGGTAYLPERMVGAAIDSGRLHRVDAPTFARRVHLVAPDAASIRWPWFTDLATDSL